tara:strand:+ start:87 stop:272 length:186 start_codon:yes stop_codon:yes gene_type:complete
MNIGDLVQIKYYRDCILNEIGIITAIKWNVHIDEAYAVVQLSDGTLSPFYSDDLEEICSSK